MLGSFLRYLNDIKIRDEHKKMTEGELKRKYGELVVPIIHEAIELYRPMKELLGDIVLDEGIIDWAKEKLGVDVAKGALSKDQWNKLWDNNEKVVNTFANTISMNDKVNYFVDVVLPQIEGADMMQLKLKNLVRKAHQLKKQNNPEFSGVLKELIKIVSDAHAMANNIQSVRGQRGRSIGDDIEKIAEKLSEDINTNNGIILG
jgi:hypothetical protein